MRYVDAAEWVKVPDKVGRCPECEARLYVDIEEWETGSGQVTEGGFSVSCENEDWENVEEEDWHRYWQGDWQPVISKVFEWLTKVIRVRVLEDGQC